MNELKTNVEKFSKERNLPPLEIIKLLQAGAAISGNEALLEALCELKWDYVQL